MMFTALATGLLTGDKDFHKEWRLYIALHIFSCNVRVNLYQQLRRMMR